MKRLTYAAVAALLVLVPWQGTVRAEPPLYTIENLGNFNGLVPAIVGTNASGQVVGNVSTNGSQAVRYTSGVGWQALPGLDTTFSVATGINANGDVVGFYFKTASDGTIQQHGFRYRDGFPLDDIQPLAGGTMSAGLAINASGDVVGVSDGVAGIVAFRATPPMAAVALPSLNGGFALACGLNNAGQAAGTSLTPAGAQHAIRIDPGSPSAVDIVPNNGPAGFSQACAIDADGAVGGQSDSAGQVHAFRFRPGAATLDDLDAFGSPVSNVEAMAGGVSVGWYTLADSSTRAFAHRDADGSFDLNSRIDGAGWVLLQAKGVNDSGAIVGDGTFNGQPAAFRLTPASTKDTTAPVIADVTANPASIFPPKGQMVPVSVTVSATDDSGAAPVCVITGITGGAAGDSSFTPGTLQGSVRAIGGRTYTFNVSCSDAAGNAAAGAVGVPVPADTTAPVIASVSASPNNLWPPDGRLVTVNVTVSATDNVDDAPACALNAITGGAAGDATISGPFSATLKAVGGTTYKLTVRCADAAGNESKKWTTVVVPADTTAPVVTALSVSPQNIWPANGKLVPVTVAVTATDDVDASPVCSLSGVGGGPAVDIVVTGPLSVKLRATKNATYVLQVTCTDKAGNSSIAAISVSVSKDQPPQVFHYNKRLRAFLHGLAHAYGRYRH